MMSDEEAQEHFDNFFEDVFIELEDKYGEIEEMNVCDNLGDHLVGNVYVKVSALHPAFCYWLFAVYCLFEINSFNYVLVSKRRRCRKSSE